MINWAPETDTKRELMVSHYHVRQLFHLIHVFGPFWVPN